MKAAIALLAILVASFSLSQPALAKCKKGKLTRQINKGKQEDIKNYLLLLKAAAEQKCEDVNLQELLDRNDNVEIKLKPLKCLTTDGWAEYEWKGIKLVMVLALSDTGCNDPLALEPIAPIEPPPPPPSPSLPLSADPVVVSETVAPEAELGVAIEVPPAPPTPEIEIGKVEQTDLTLMGDGPKLVAPPSDPLKIIKEEEGPDLPFGTIMWSGVAITGVGVVLASIGGGLVYHGHSTADGISRETHTQMEAADDRVRAGDRISDGQSLLIAGPIISAIGLGVAAFGLFGDNTSVDVLPGNGGGSMHLTFTW